MVLHMTRPTRRPDSSHLQFRKRVPADIQKAAYGKSAAVSFPAGSTGEPATVIRTTLREQVKFSLQTRDPATAKERNGLATAQLERFYDALRKGPLRLTQKQVVALAGELYNELTLGLQDDPGEANIWRLAREVHERALSDPARMERWFGESVDELLLRKGLVVDAESRLALLKEVARVFIEASERLEKNANGDYRPDTNVERFPSWEVALGKPSGPASRSKNSLTFDQLFEKWRLETAPAPSTVTTWRSYVRALRKHVGHDDPSRVTKPDIVAWKDALVQAGYHPKGIRDGQLAAIRRLYSYALDNELLSLPTNPTQGVKLRVKRTAGSRMLPYSDDEVARILSLADKETKPYRRWLPWLMALSGARVGEVAQLWGNRITEVDGIVVMKIAPAEDGGSLKNEGSERQVPIHPAILQRGFLEFARAKGKGPLFYGGTRKGSAKSCGRRHASKGVANHLAAWIREKGFADKRKAPNHAFRHWFKTACQEAGVVDSVADAIQGHSGTRGEADGYRHSGISVMNEAVKRIKVPVARTNTARTAHASEHDVDPENGASAGT
jgi:integrase